MAEELKEFTHCRHQTPRGTEEPEEPHVCPYNEDINNDPSIVCTCCSVCTEECARDV